MATEWDEARVTRMEQKLADQGERLHTLEAEHRGREQNCPMLRQMTRACQTLEELERDVDGHRVALTEVRSMSASNTAGVTGLVRRADAAEEQLERQATMIQGISWRVYVIMAVIVFGGSALGQQLPALLKLL